MHMHVTNGSNNITVIVCCSVHFIVPKLPPQQHFHHRESQHTEWAAAQAPRSQTLACSYTAIFIYSLHSVMYANI